MEGGAYSQSLIHTMDLAAFKADGNMKLVFIASPQWFWGAQTNSTGLSAKFSELRYYSFMLGDFPDSSKQYVSKRLLECQVTGVSLSSYAYMAVNFLPEAFKPLKLAADLPMWVGEQYLSTKDKYQAYKLFADSHFPTQPVRSVDWAAEKQKAIDMGQAAVTDNPYNISDSYYDEYVQPVWDKNKDTMSGTPTLTNPEYGAYALFLKTCADKGIKPLIIIPSCNGYVYDHYGMTRDMREAVNQRVRSMAESYGFEVLSFTDHDYDPYYLRDIMHLGWLGWYEVDEKIADYFN